MLDSEGVSRSTEVAKIPILGVEFALSADRVVLAAAPYCTSAAPTPLVATG